MMDHEQVSMLARGASFLYGAPNASPLPRHPESVVPWLYYCDPLDGVDPLGRAVEPTTLVDVTAQVDAKLDMLACHASQREWLRAHHGMDEYIEAARRHAANRGCGRGSCMRRRSCSTGGTRIRRMTCWRGCLGDATDPAAPLRARGMARGPY